MFIARNAKGATIVSSCQHDEHSAHSLYERLGAQGIITTARLGRLRISPHFYNKKEEIDLLVESLKN